MAGDALENASPIVSSLSDAELLTLFTDDPERAWKLFIDRYADIIFSYLHTLGFNYDQSMDRFVYVCEKLCEQDFRRMKTIKYAGRRGELTPWVRKVVRHLCINWAWSTEGRRRLFKPVAKLPALEQRIFELYFWKGLSPTEIHEQLRYGQPGLTLVETLDALERIFSVLSHKNLWRLTSNLAWRRGPVSLDEIDEGMGIEPVDPAATPEELVIKKEAEERMSRALDGLRPKERLMIQFRYEEGMSPREISEMLGVGEKEVKNSLRGALTKLKRTLEVM